MLFSSKESSDLTWQGMRLMRDLRRENKAPIEQKSDSKYRDITERAEVRKFNPVRIPRKLQRDLPFASKPKDVKKRASDKPLYKDRRAVVMEPEEKKIVSLLQQISTLKKEKENKKKKKMAEKKEEFLKKKAKEEKLDAIKDRERRKEYFKKQSLQQQKEKRKLDMHDAAFAKKQKV